MDFFRILRFQICTCDANSTIVPSNYVHWKDKKKEKNNSFVVINQINYPSFNEDWCTNATFFFFPFSSSTFVTSIAFEFFDPSFRPFLLDVPKSWYLEGRKSKNGTTKLPQLQLVPVFSIRRSHSREMVVKIIIFSISSLAYSNRAQCTCICVYISSVRLDIDAFVVYLTMYLNEPIRERRLKKREREKLKIKKEEKKRNKIK